MKSDLEKIHEDVPADHYDQGIKNNLFQKFWHYRRFNEVVNSIEPVSGAVLDVGCHGGTFTQKILTRIRSKKIYGVDISDNAINLITKRIPYGHFKKADAVTLPFKNNFFDAVFCLEMLEHTDNPLQVLKEIKRVLKKEGYCTLLVPSENRLFQIVWFLWTLYYPVWRHAHVNNFKKNSLENIVYSLRLKITKVKTFHLGMLKMIVFQK